MSRSLPTIVTAARLPRGRASRGAPPLPGTRGTWSRVRSSPHPRPLVPAPQKPDTMRLSIARLLGPILLLALLPVLALQAPSVAATTRPADGLSEATAAGSCWEIKQHNNSAPDGVY